MTAREDGWLSTWHASCISAGKVYDLASLGLRMEAHDRPKCLNRQKWRRAAEKATVAATTMAGAAGAVVVMVPSGMRKSARKSEIGGRTVMGSARYARGLQGIKARNRGFETSGRTF